MEKLLSAVFNWSVDLVLEQYDNMYAFNIDQIKPDNIDYFEDTRISLTKKGLRTYWKELDNLISRIDYNRVAPLKMLSVRREGRTTDAPVNWKKSQKIKPCFQTQ